jgi:hypothetical protein
MDEFITVIIVLLSCLMAVVMAAPIEDPPVSVRVSDKSVAKIDQKVIDMLIIVDPETIDQDEEPEGRCR